MWVKGLLLFFWTSYVNGPLMGSQMAGCNSSFCVVAGQLPGRKTGWGLRKGSFYLMKWGMGKTLRARQKIPLHPTLQQPATHSAVTWH